MRAGRGTCGVHQHQWMERADGGRTGRALPGPALGVVVGVVVVASDGEVASGGAVDDAQLDYWRRVDGAAVGWWSDECEEA